MRRIPNIITSIRILIAVAIVLISPFSVPFWICYVSGGLTDFFDGFIARKFHFQSKSGAKLDSIADLIFAVAITYIALKYVSFPSWLWIFIICTAVIRIVSYWIGFIKFRTFASLHTYANKLTGGAIFLFPVFYVLMGVEITGIILSVIAIISSIEEMMIIITSPKLVRDCKSFFYRTK